MLGKYPVVRLLKGAGQAWVYLCQDPDVPRLVAVKVMRGDLDDPEIRERFKREVSALGALRHRNVVTVFGVETHERAPCLVMEYIPGETLADLISRREPISLQRKLQIIDDICSALGHAHAAGIVHRDVKPSNVMIDVDGTVKVLDFGIARTQDSELTHLGSMLGTVSYMSPEQLDDRPIDPRTDVFAVGAVMYELLGYQRAFAASSREALIARILRDDPEPLSARYPDLPPALSEIPAKAMRKDPADRYQDMQAFRDALAAVSQPADVTLVGSRSQVSNTAPVTAGPSTTPRVTSRRWIGAVALLGGAAGLVWIVLTFGSVGRSAVPAPQAPVAPEVTGEVPPPNVPAPPLVDAEEPRLTPTAPTAPSRDVRQPPTPVAPAPDPPARTAEGTSQPGPSDPTRDAEPEAPVPGPVPGPGPGPAAAPPSTPATVAVPAPEPPPPAVTAPPPAPRAAVNHRQLIDDVLTRYAAALSHRSVDEVAALRRMDDQALASLRQQFANVRSWQVDIANRSIDVADNGQRATVRATMTYRDVAFDQRVVGRPSNRRVELTLERTSESWTIVNLVER